MAVLLEACDILLVSQWTFRQNYHSVLRSQFKQIPYSLKRTGPTSSISTHEKRLVKISSLFASCHRNNRYHRQCFSHDESPLIQGLSCILLY